ncbi:MAG TPA: thioesterase family protein [Labilithrix sp.]|nr:thioesterase family protein [Labilithrix sp.]
MLLHSAPPPSSSAVHSLAFVVPDSDIDELGHASNIAYVRWIQDVAVSHSAAKGFDFGAYQKLGGIFVVRRHEIDYMRPVLRGDRLELRTWVDTAMAAKCLRATQILTEDGTVAARAITTWGYVEMATGRPARIPQVVRDAFGMTSRSSITAESG